MPNGNVWTTVVVQVRMQRVETAVRLEIYESMSKNEQTDKQITRTETHTTESVKETIIREQRVCNALRR